MELESSGKLQKEEPSSNEMLLFLKTHLSLMYLSEEYFSVKGEAGWDVNLTEQIAAKAQEPGFLKWDFEVES